MRQEVHKYAVGEHVLLHGKEAIIEARSFNVNGRPVYRLCGVWRGESDIEPWSPPCPV